MIVERKRRRCHTATLPFPNAEGVDEPTKCYIADIDRFANLAVDLPKFDGLVGRPQCVGAPDFRLRRTASGALGSLTAALQTHTPLSATDDVFLIDGCTKLHTWSLK